MNIKHIHIILQAGPCEPQGLIMDQPNAQQFIIPDNYVKYLQKFQ